MPATRLATVVLVASAAATGCSRAGPGGDGQANIERGTELSTEMDRTADKVIAAAEDALDGELPAAAGRWTECNLNGTGHVNYEVGGSLVAPKLDRAEIVERLSTSLSEVGIELENDPQRGELRDGRQDYEIFLNYGRDTGVDTLVDIDLTTECMTLGRDAVKELTSRPTKMVRGSAS